MSNTIEIKESLLEELLLKEQKYVELRREYEKQSIDLEKALINLTEVKRIIIVKEKKQLSKLIKKESEMNLVNEKRIQKFQYKLAEKEKQFSELEQIKSQIELSISQKSKYQKTIDDLKRELLELRKRKEQSENDYKARIAEFEIKFKKQSESNIKIKKKSPTKRVKSNLTDEERRKLLKLEELVAKSVEYEEYVAKLENEIEKKDKLISEVIHIDK